MHYAQTRDMAPLNINKAYDQKEREVCQLIPCPFPPGGFYTREGAARPFGLSLLFLLFSVFC